ncbi:MAG: hypothetical protein EA402_01575 [Planctomycetota bacterium]|nr:MAG: hypothetical protein EA402_01575 [Planctomycetota bacterium]
MTKGRIIVLMFVIFMGILLLMSVERFSIVHRADEFQTRFRLKRLGVAVNQWVADQGHQRFPRIINPPPVSPWDPQRMGSAHAVLGPYLQGDVPMLQREGESAQDFYLRRLNQELTVDPHTGFEFWYNIQLIDRDPSQVENQHPEWWYFRAQRDRDGEWPHRNRGELGSWLVRPVLVQRQIGEADIRSMRERLSRLEERNRGLPPSAWSHDLDFLRSEVQRLEEAHRQFGEVLEDGQRVLTQVALEPAVGFKSGEEILGGPRP